MHVRSKKNRSGSISVVVVDKSSGRYKELHTVGVPKEESKIESFRQKGLEWIRRRKLAMQPELDLYGEERRILEYEVEMTERVVANIDNILISFFAAHSTTNVPSLWEKPRGKRGETAGLSGKNSGGVW